MKRTLNPVVDVAGYLVGYVAYFVISFAIVAFVVVVVLLPLWVPILGFLILVGGMRAIK